MGLNKCEKLVYVICIMIYKHSERLWRNEGSLKYEDCLRTLKAVNVNIKFESNLNRKSVTVLLHNRLQMNQVTT